MQLRALFSLAVAASVAWAQDQYGGQYQDPTNLPARVDASGGQTGWNDCAKRYGASSKKARCQNIFINSVHDFCIFAPRAKNRGTIGDQEEHLVSYCLKSGYGTRLIPDGTIQGAHFLRTPQFLQVTGHGDFTKVNISPGDEGGELDPHGATGSGNPIGGLVFTRARGHWERLPEWQHFISHNEYCFRACFADEPYAREWCPHVYDVMGCYWNEPANYDNGVFEQCRGDPGEWPGVYSGSTFWQGQPVTPPAQTAGKSSKCHYHSTVRTGRAIKPLI